MTPEDLELLADLRRRQEELRLSLRQLDLKLGELEKTAAAEILPPLPESHPALPPVPPVIPPPVPPIPQDAASPVFPPLPAPEPAVARPSAPLRPAVPAEAFEVRVARWLTRIGAFLLVLTLVFLDVLLHLGAWANLAVIGAISMGVVLFGQRLERRGPELQLYGRTILAAGLAGLYFMAYAASSVDALRVIHSPILGGIVLLLWSVFVLRLAGERRSQPMGFAALLLAYVSTAVNPLNSFTLGADLLLAGTSVFLLLRHGWTAVSYLALAGTYLALLRRLVLDESGMFSLDSRVIHLLPHLGYLAGAWLLFTAAVLLARTPGFRSARRVALLSLNNGLGAILLVIALHVGGFDAQGIGRGLMIAGALVLGAWVLARRFLPDDHDTNGAFLAQAAVLLLGGAMVVFTGGERAVLFLLAAFFLGAAGAFFGSAVLRVCGYVAAFLATLFATWEIGCWGHSPWLFGLAGAAVMFLNAGWARRSSRAEDWVEGSAFYSVLGTALVAVMLAVGLNGEEIAPGLALAAVILTVAAAAWLPELPGIAQTLLVAAQAMVLFPGETGEVEGPWPFILVSAATLAMILWWAARRRVPAWIPVLRFIYAVALTGLAYRGCRPHFEASEWMIATSVLAATFLAFGAVTRAWAVAICGQLFLLLVVVHFLAPGTPWTWPGRAVPLAVVFTTGMGIRGWLRAFPEIRGWRRRSWRTAAYLLQLLALLMALVWIHRALAAPAQIEAALFLGTGVLAWSVRRSSSLGVRTSFLPTAIGVLGYVVHGAGEGPTRLLALAVLALLSQPGLLRNGIRVLVSRAEQWILLVAAVVAGWIFVSRWALTSTHHVELTLAWGIYAVFVFFFGLALWERRLRWTGLAVLICAVGRVIFVDLWGGHSTGYKVTTLLILTIITLGLGYLYSRHGDRLKAWL